MSKFKLSVMINIILSMIIAVLCVQLYTSDNHEKSFVAYPYRLYDAPPQEEGTTHLCIINKEQIQEVQETVGMMVLYKKICYFQADKATLEPFMLKENDKLHWYEIKTRDLSNYHIEGYFAYLRNKEVHLVPHYVKDGYEINLMEEFDNKDMMLYTIGYLDEHMYFYNEEPLAKQRQVGFISDDQMFTYVEMKYHNVLEVKDKYSNMYACYVRTTNKTNTLESLDLSANGTYKQWIEKYPMYNDDNDYIDLYDYWSCLKRVDLGGKVKIREHAESNTSEYLHAYNFASKAKTFAGVIQFREEDSKDKKWKLDASVTWNFKQEPFTLKFELE